MAFIYDNETGNITIPAGDTADINVTINYSNLKDGDVVVFAVFDKYSKEKDVVKKVCDIAEGKAVIRLCNHDTRDVAPKTYNWQLRIVTGPARDSEGNVIADDCTDNVITVFNNPPTFKIVRGGAYV